MALGMSPHGVPSLWRGGVGDGREARCLLPSSSHSGVYGVAEPANAGMWGRDVARDEKGPSCKAPRSMARCVSPVPLPSWPCAAPRTSFECRGRGGTRWSFVPSTRWTVACTSWLPPFCTRSFRLRKMLLGKCDLVKRMIPMTGYLRVIWPRRATRQWSAEGHPPDESPCPMRSARVGAVDRGFPHGPLPGERSAGPRLRPISRGLRGPVGRTACGFVRVHCGNAGP